tara:strand:+ start:3075 stop:4286 length:1212 start_codon:yes stop_codon:yes gene_type:complete
MKLTKPQTKIYDDPARFRVIVAGRRFGKTFLSTAEILSKALSAKDQHVWYVAPTYKAAKEIAWDMLLSHIPATYIVKKNESALAIVLVNGSTIALKGAEKPDNLRGRSLDFVVLDEFADMRPQAWYEVLRPSLSDRGGSAVFIGTPKGRNHFYDLYGKGLDGDDGWSSHQYTTIEGGNVAPSEIASAKADLDERTFEQEYQAKFVNYSGIIYYGFKREESVVRHTDDISVIHVGMDFNLDPMSAVLMTRKGDTLHIFDEIVMFGSNTDEMVAELRERYGNGTIVIYPDPASRQRKTSAGGRTDLSILQNAGFEVRVRNSHAAVRDRINAVNSRLLSNDGQRRLYVDPKCKKVIESLERHTYKEGTSQPEKDGFDHMNDALGYAVEYLFPIRKANAPQAPQRWT